MHVLPKYCTAFMEKMTGEWGTFFILTVRHNMNMYEHTHAD